MRSICLKWPRPGLIHITVFVIILLLTSSCNDEDLTGSNKTRNKPANPAGSLVARSDCKKYESKGTAELQTSPDQDCGQYQFDGQGVLTLKHINAGFNCCPGEINADINIDGYSITITEREGTNGCHCLCLFDLDYQFENVEPGVYQVEFIEPYTNEDDEPLIFTLDLSQADSGEFCVKRAHYPWDAGLAGGF
jgi:hypothetical protein